MLFGAVNLAMTLYNCFMVNPQRFQYKVKICSAATHFSLADFGRAHYVHTVGVVSSYDHCVVFATLLLLRNSNHRENEPK